MNNISNANKPYKDKDKDRDRFKDDDDDAKRPSKRK